MDEHTLDFFRGDVISSPPRHYEVQKVLGCGSYGQVFRCKDLTTYETVAIKIMKRESDTNCAKQEEDILKTMKKLHSEGFNIISFKGSFTYKQHYCLVFEHLDMDLGKFKLSSPGHHLQLNQIRPILQQLATSLDFLKQAGIIHSDLKPENIMMVDPVREPLRVKVIDFGLAMQKPEIRVGRIHQTLWYRSPEILRCVSFNEAIDVWSLGCIAAELYMGSPLFPAVDETDLMRRIMSMKSLDGRTYIPYWFSPKNWMEKRFVETHLHWGIDDKAEYHDMQCFIDLLTQMLIINPLDRIQPQQILQHPFLTMSHLRGLVKHSYYLKWSKGLMDTCQLSDDGADDPANVPSSCRTADPWRAVSLTELHHHSWKTTCPGNRRRGARK